MLGDGYKPVGTVFTLLSGGPLTGTFLNIEGLVFDDGREHYLLDYGIYAADVTLTVENNTTPKPGSVLLISMGLVGILGTSWARKRRPYLPGAAAKLVTKALHLTNL